MEQTFEKKTPMQRWPSLAQFARTLPLKGGNLFYYGTDGAAGTAAKEQPALFLIHGLGDEADSFRYLIPLLSNAGFRVIAPDLPGFGRSNGNSPDPLMSPNCPNPWKRKSSLKEHSEAILTLMKETGTVSPENPAVLIGSSMGATISQLIACAHPELVKGIVLIDGCQPLSGKADPGLLLIALPFVGKKWYRNFRKDHEGVWKTLYAYYRDLDAMSGEDKKFLRNRVIDRVESSSQERAYFSSLRSMIGLIAFKGNKFSRAMKAFTGKILLLWGESDKVVPFENASRFLALHPGAEYQIISGAGHLPQQEAPNETAAAILKWLNAASGSRTDI